MVILDGQASQHRVAPCLGNHLKGAKLHNFIYLLLIQRTKLDRRVKLHVVKVHVIGFVETVKEALEQNFCVLFHGFRRSAAPFDSVNQRIDVATGSRQEDGLQSPRLAFAADGAWIIGGGLRARPQRHGMAWIADNGHGGLATALDHKAAHHIIVRAIGDVAVVGNLFNRLAALLHALAGRQISDSRLSGSQKNRRHLAVVFIIHRTATRQVVS